MMPRHDLTVAQPVVNEKLWETQIGEKSEISTLYQTMKTRLFVAYQHVMHNASLVCLEVFT